MRYKTQAFDIAGITAYYPSESKPEKAVYLLSDNFFDEILPPLMGLVCDGMKKSDIPPMVLIVCNGGNWNSAYSPWPAPGLRPNDDDFGGNGKNTIAGCESVKSAVCSAFDISDNRDNHALLGYSLSALCALYGVYLTDSFSMCGCCSGSLWYDGWMDYMEKNDPKDRYKVYFSLGKKEEKTRSSRMCSIGADVQRGAEILSEHGCDTIFIRNNGGHDHEVPRRLYGAIAWLLGGKTVQIP